VAVPRVSVVLPCLNEERTVADCVFEARRGIERLGVPGEVVVVDNGSTDASVRLAAAAGARVVLETRRGYGAALGRGMREAQGEMVVFGDADRSYAFDDLKPFWERIRAGADLVMGSRLRGTVEPGAMPWLNRRLGTPVLTLLVNLLFRTRISDVNCGQRALSRRAVDQLDLRAAGMEFASEMVIKAGLAGFRVEEVPIPFRHDGRDRPPHLRRWRDGWRHLRFILLFAPNVLLVAPGLALVAFGLAIGGGRMLLGRPGVSGAAAFGSACLLLLGSQLVHVGVLVKTWYHVEGFYRRPYLDRLFRYVGFEAGLLVSLGLIALGMVVGTPLLLSWSNGVPVQVQRVAATLTLLGLGMQTFTASVLLTVLGIRRR